jgi:hypothetical protein
MLLLQIYIKSTNTAASLGEGENASQYHGRDRDVVTDAVIPASGTQ